MGHEKQESDSTALVRAEAPARAVVEAGAQALTAQIEARIKATFFLARQFPRNWLDVRSKLLAAFKRPILAEGAIYKKPIGDGKVEGLSIRFSEEAFRAMGNVTVETMLVSDDEDKRVYIVTGTDMETLASLPVSVVVTKQMERSRLKEGDVLLGERKNSRGVTTYVIKARSEDDYRSKEQALLQKARRDVIQFLLPGDIKEECEAQIRTTLDDEDRKDPQGAIMRVADLFYKEGVSVAEIEKYLGHPLTSMNTAELHILRTLHTMIKEGEGTWVQVIEQKLGTNTGADADERPAKTGAGAKLAEAAKGGAAPPPPAATGEARIAELRKKKTRTDEEEEDIRCWDIDHPPVA
jgi:hypothetical protein